VAKYEDNTPRTKKVMIHVQVSGRPGNGSSNGNAARTITIPQLFFQKKTTKNKIAFEKNAMPPHGSNFIAVHQRTRK
jgi:hypothetical protein